MKNQINISEILKDCPKGTKLYSPLCGECEFINIINDIIYVESSLNKTLCFNSLGMFFEWYEESECLLFPSKDQRDWSKFQQPFKDGDIISNGRYVAIFHKTDKPENCVNSNVVYYHCWYNNKYTYNKFKAKIDFGIGCIEEYKYATEKEKQKLFDAIKVNGYKWNAEDKTLEKLPKFKVGDIIRYVGENFLIKIIGIKNNQYQIECFCDKYNDYKNGIIPVSEENNYMLIPKFDINTLKPFESKVLVRDEDTDNWKGSFYSHYKSKKFYTIGSSYYYQCIPYESNEHLLDTTNDCEEFYKNW